MRNHIYYVNLKLLIYLFIGIWFGCLMFWSFLGIFLVKFVRNLKCIFNNKKSKSFQNLFH